MTYFKRNHELDATLASNTTMNKSGFLKLLALGLFDILLTLPITILGLVQDLLHGNIAGFWPGWGTVHASFSTIPTVTTEEWKSAGLWIVLSIRFNQWLCPIFAVAFFLLFGTTKEKRTWYWSIFWKVMRPLGLKPHVTLVASDIVFGSGPIVNPAADDSQGTTM